MPVDGRVACGELADLRIGKRQKRAAAAANRETEELGAASDIVVVTCDGAEGVSAIRAKPTTSYNVPVTAERSRLV